jgi:anti-anti-sigma regulatory factor
MSENIEKEVFVIPEKFTISECEEQYALLTEKINANHAFKLDASEVKQIDTAGLQLLSVMFSNNDSKEVNFSWSDVSEELMERASILGLHKYFIVKQ